MALLNSSFSEHALEILRERYLRRDDAGELAETPDGMLERRRRSREDFWRGYSVVGGAFSRPDATSRVLAKFSHLNERRTARRAARSLFRIAYRR